MVLLVRLQPFNMELEYAGWYCVNISFAISFGQFLSENLISKGVKKSNRGTITLSKLLPITPLRPPP